MKTEAVSAGYYHSPGWNKDYPRIKILTIEELLHGAEVKMPPQLGTFKQAQKVDKQAEAEQAELGFGYKPVISLIRVLLRWAGTMYRQDERPSQAPRRDTRP